VDPLSHGAREVGELGAAVLTVSTSKAGGEGEDESGPALAAFAERLGARVIGTEVIPDEQELLEGRLRWWCDEGGCELVLTTGGTGFAPSDVTPEATVAVIEREAPGIAEAMRAASRDHTVHWMLSRAVAGIRGRTLIVNFPGSPKSIEEAGAAIADALPHALRLLAGEGGGHSA
jgi:molybdopterin adenylyltransferase